MNHDFMCEHEIDLDLKEDYIIRSLIMEITVGGMKIQLVDHYKRAAAWQPGFAAPSLSEPVFGIFCV